MPIVVKGKISRNAGHHYGQVRVQRVEGVTADGIWTADTVCITADGKIICIPADVLEPATASDTFDALVVAGGAVIDADVAEATTASDLADAVSVVAADAIEAASALDDLDAATDVAAAAIGYVLTGFDATFSIAPSATVVGYVLTGFDATFSIAPSATTTGYAITGFDAAFVVEPVEQAAIGGGVWVDRPRRPFLVEGYGYGILPQLEGEAHGVVGAVGKSAGQVFVRADAVGACGLAGNATVVLKALSVAGKGAVGTRGSGEGMITKFSGSATGRHDDDEAAVIAFLLAA